MYDMYQEIILDYYRNPRNKGKLDNPDAESEDVNPSCGDKVKINLKIKDNKIKDIKFNGEGCAISQSAVSMLTEAIKGKTLKEASKFSKKELLETLGIELSASRLKCALLGLKVFKTALYNFMEKKISDTDDIS